MESEGDVQVIRSNHHLSNNVTITWSHHHYCQSRLTSSWPMPLSSDNYLSCQCSLIWCLFPVMFFGVIGKQHTNIEKKIGSKEEFMWKEEKQSQIDFRTHKFCQNTACPRSNFAKVKYYILETKPFWPLVGKAKMCLRNIQFSWFSKILFTFSVVCLQKIQINV